MSLAKRLLAMNGNRSNRQRAKGVSQSASIAVDKPLDEALNGSASKTIRLAAMAAAAEYARIARDNLRQHNSAQTGTGGLRSKRAAERRERLGPTISEQVETVWDEETQTAIVQLNPNVEHIGRFLEYENPQKYWGHDPVNAPTQLTPKPWLRPAYDTGKESATRAMSNEIERRLNG